MIELEPKQLGSESSGAVSAESSVNDDSYELDAATCSCIFEPLFTTRLRGRGTALGFAPVLEVVHENRGSSGSHSRPRHGHGRRSRR